jgi:hypothetical protein
MLSNHPSSYQPQSATMPMPFRGKHIVKLNPRQRRAKRACNGLGPRRDVNPHVDEGGDDSIEEAFRGKRKPNPMQRRAKRACNGLGPRGVNPHVEDVSGSHDSVRAIDGESYEENFKPGYLIKMLCC